MFAIEVSSVASLTNKDPIMQQTKHFVISSFFWTIRGDIRCEYLLADDSHVMSSLINFLRIS